MSKEHLTQLLKAALAIGFRLAENRYNKSGTVASSEEIDKETVVIEGLLLREPRFLNSENMWGAK